MEKREERFNMRESPARSKRVSFGMAISFLILFYWTSVAFIPFVSANSTWVILDETVVIEDTTRIHAGNIILCGNSRLFLRNATLELEQVTYCQFYVKIEDSCQLVTDKGSLESKHAFKIFAQESAKINATNTMARRSHIELSGEAKLSGNSTRFNSLLATESSEIDLENCHLEEIRARDASDLIVRNCSVAVMEYEEDARVVVDSSSISFTVCDGHQQANFTASVLGSIRCWKSADVHVSGCTIGDFRYSDFVTATIVKSNLDHFEANGRLPLLLTNLTINAASLQGYANVNMDNCIVSTLTARDNSVLNFSMSSSNLIYIEWSATAQIQGTQASPCEITEYYAYHDAKSNISWAQFDYIELGTNTRTYLSDSEAGYLHNWCYETNRLEVFRSNFTDLRISGATNVTLANSTIKRYGNMGDVNLTASHCEIYSLNLYSSSRGRFHNCTIDALAPWGQAQIILDKSEAGIMINDEDGQLQALDSLPVGQIDHWQSNESGSIKTFQWNLTVDQSEITLWNVHVHQDVECNISNCALAWVPCYGSSRATFVNVTVGDLSVGENADVIVENGVLTILQTHGNGLVELTNSSLDRLQTEGTSQILIRSNLSGPSWYWIRHESRVVRELETLVVNHLGTPISDALVEIFRSDQTLIHQVYTDSSGKCSFNLTFTSSSSLTEVFTCRATAEGSNNSLQFDIHASPPLAIILDLSESSAFLNDAGTQSTSVGPSLRDQFSEDSVMDVCRRVLVEPSFRSCLLLMSGIFVVIVLEHRSRNVRARKQPFIHVGKTHSVLSTFVSFKPRRFTS